MKVPRGATLMQAWSNWLLPRPGSPTISICGSERIGICD